MSNKEKMPPGRLYLDVDGVILAEEIQFDDADEIYYESKASKYVCSRLGQSGLELVWLSTWEDSILLTVDMYPTLHDLKGGRAICRTEKDYFNHQKAIDWKTEVLVDEQLRSPTPFVWVEDQMTDRHIERVLTGLRGTRNGLSQLFVRPQKRTGLVDNELSQIEEFTTNLGKRRYD